MCEAAGVEEKARKLVDSREKTGNPNNIGQPPCWIRDLSSSALFCSVMLSVRIRRRAVPVASFLIITSSKSILSILDCDGRRYELKIEEIRNLSTVLPYAGICVGLVLFAGLMSGLTIGLMSLDEMQLRIMKGSGTDTEKSRASRILPILKHHHWVLVSLLLCNAAAMEALPIFLDDIVDKYIAIAISVSAVLVFGEILPQAICVKFGMAIGANTAWFVRILMFLTGIISWPIGKLLDLAFGEEKIHKFSRHELRELVHQHKISNEGPLSIDESTVITGALDMTSKTVRDAMRPIKDVFMIDWTTRYTKELVDELLRRGHSRVPVYEMDRSRIKGLLLVKKLISVDPDKNMKIKELELPHLPTVPDDMALYDLLNQFQLGRSHMAAVKSKETDLIVGMITLEDLIEELIQEEISDEFDMMDPDDRVAATRAKKIHIRTPLMGKFGSYYSSYGTKDPRITKSYAPTTHHNYTDSY
ncbi:hypothetical protein PROFUN_01249 [Planoprotostelium fungivorum]|uniref:CNNM transmembrane domain-containing protein n=1 Tax=Planoprotostelium fungivorum TaxID=1890364 RepID=A0A2P6NZJ8_9EUKA|nr:hypothetical protein PROFUN_01249 [Planoprotostelium fungivorum]